MPESRMHWSSGGTAIARSRYFLTTPILGLMYYCMPKVANRPVYSYRLSVIHFWALIFPYIWPVRITCSIPRFRTGHRTWEWFSV